jgi:chemosensory pili system protein ChpA (sensor histidine kinase/response regulator)
MQVLIVDPESAQATSLAELVRRLGHEPVVAHNAETAIQVAAEQGPQCVIVAVGQSKLDGYILARQLRDEAGLMESTILSVSPYPGDPNREHAATINAHLRQPVDIEQLSRLLSD